VLFVWGGAVMTIILAYFAASILVCLFVGRVAAL
jgi:hypothetical protein